MHAHIGDYACSNTTAGIDLVHCQPILLGACPQMTALELMSWRALLQLQPEAVLMVARASVHDSTIVRVEQLRCGGFRILAHG